MIIFNHPLFKLQIYVQIIMFEMIVKDNLRFLNDVHSLIIICCDSNPHCLGLT